MSESKETESQQPDNEPLSPKTQNMYMVVLGVCMELMALEISLLYAGRYLDQKMGTPGVWIAVGGITALVIWIVHLVKVMSDIEKIDKKDQRKDPKNP